MGKRKKMYRIVYKSKKSSRSWVGLWTTALGGLREMRESLNRVFPARTYTIQEAPYDAREIQ